MNPGAAAALSRQRLINGIKLLETLCIAIVTPLSSQERGFQMVTALAGCSPVTAL